VTSIDDFLEREERAPAALLLTKLHPPAAGTQTVARGRLLERLRPEPGMTDAVRAARRRGLLDRSAARVTRDGGTAR